MNASSSPQSIPPTLDQQLTDARTAAQALVSAAAFRALEEAVNHGT